MPDHSSAASEHALMQEISGPLTTLPDDPVPIAANVEFPTSLRGYDRLAVDAYVRRTSQLVAELQATRSPDSAIRRALERVGDEVAGILQRAHETAQQITMQSRSEAEDRMDRARKEAAEITAAAENRLKELDAETDRIWAERHRIVEDTRELARQLLALADTAVERFPPAEEIGSREPLGAAAGHAGEAEPQGDQAEAQGGEAEPQGGEAEAQGAIQPEDDLATRPVAPVEGDQPYAYEGPEGEADEGFEGEADVEDDAAADSGSERPFSGEEPFGRPQTVGGQEQLGGHEFGEPQVRRGIRDPEEQPGNREPLERPDVDDADATIVMPPVVPREDREERR